jgi:hypothetical protein
LQEGGERKYTYACAAVCDSKTTDTHGWGGHLLVGTKWSNGMRNMNGERQQEQQTGRLGGKVSSSNKQQHEKGRRKNDENERSATNQMFRPLYTLIPFAGLLTQPPHSRPTPGGMFIMFYHPREREQPLNEPTNDIHTGTIYRSRAAAAHPPPPRLRRPCFTAQTLPTRRAASGTFVVGFLINSAARSFLINANLLSFFHQRKPSSSPFVLAFLISRLRVLPCC